MVPYIKNNLREIPFWLKSIIIICIVSGIFLRFYNLDGKLFSNDETFSATYIFGQNITEVIDAKIVSVSELQSYQKYNANESLIQAFQRLIDRPYVFPPLYAFILQIWARFWSFFLTDPAIITRSCSVFISLFSFPLMYWLCWELFQSSSVAWMGMAILAISPVQLQYAQIVRTYSLLIAATLLSSAALLLALRVPKGTNWWIYAFTVTLGLYSSVLFGFVVISHVFYMIIDAKGKITKTIQQYLLASLLGISLFLPWLYLFLTKPGLLGYSVSQVAKKESITGLIQIWVRSILRIFIDLNDSWVESSKPFLLLQRISFPLLLVFLFVSLGYLILKAGKNKHSMILSLIIAGGGFLMIKDAWLGGGFSTRLRYMLPYVIGWQLTAIAFIAYLFYSRSNWQRKLSKIILSSLLVLGLLSCVIIVQAPSWWAFGAPDYPAIAQKVNQLSKPVVLYDNFGDALTMSYLLQENVYSHLTRRADFHLQNSPTDLYKGYSDIVIFQPSPDLIAKLQNSSNLKLVPLFQSKGIYPRKPNAWKVIRPEF